VLVLLVMACTVQASAQQVKMTLWVNSWPAKAVAGIQEIADRFAARHSEVSDVEVVPLSHYEHKERLILAVVSDTPPDVVTLAAPFAQYARAGLLQPLDKCFEASDVVGLDDYPPFLIGAFSSQGVVYGIPSIEAALGEILVYNKDIFSESGLPSDQPPVTLDELQQAHRKLTRLDTQGDQLTQLGLNPLDAMGGYYFPTIWGTIFDIDYYDEVTNKINLMGYEIAVDWIKNIYDYPDYDLISQFSGTIGWWTSGVASGKLAMQINGSWVPGELRSLGSTLDIGYTWMPSVHGDRATASLPWGQGIPINAPHPDLSWKLIECFATPEGAQIMFDAVGWLNGNLSSMSEIDVGDMPVIKDIIAMFNQADRFNAPQPLPILGDLRNEMSGALGVVWRDEDTARNVLTNLQKRMQQKLEEYGR